MRSDALVPWISKAGYAVVSLRKAGRNHGVHLGRIICRAFRGPPPTRKHQAAHSDGNPRNYRWTNLRWATPKENCDDRELHGRTLRGEKHHKAKLTNRDVLRIRRIHKATSIGGRVAYGLGKRLSEEYGVSKDAIFSVIHRKKWTHI